MQGRSHPTTRSRGGWIHQAYFANPDADLMLDYERLYDFLMTAAEAGNELALEILLDIWPPEEEIEED